MRRSTFAESAVDAALARAMGPVSDCARYSMPAGDRYCGGCAAVAEAISGARRSEYGKVLRARGTWTPRQSDGLSPVDED
jgi:hypothetical protein